MDYLRQLLEASSSIPLLSALILGLMTAISPCPLATNITATAYIARQFNDKKSVLKSGLWYTLGRSLSYLLVASLLFIGLSKFQVARSFQSQGERLLGPILILLGLVLLNVIKLPALNGGGPSLQERFGERFKHRGHLGAFLLGVLFALAFCPYSGALFFGILIPLSLKSSEGLLIPLVFALGTGLPVLLFTYLMAYSIQKVGVYFNAIQRIEVYMRYATGLIFILTGLYYVAIFAGWLA